MEKENKWKRGILFDFDEDEGKIIIGVKSNGATQRSYILNHTDMQTGDWSLYEILQYIVELARKQKPPIIWKACPRNVALGAMEQINSMYNEADNPNFKTKELIEQIPELIKEIPKQKEVFTAKDIVNLDTIHPRKEFRAQDVTRWELESYICKGCIEKVASADETSEIKKSNNKYKQAQKGNCEFWKKDKSNCWSCTLKPKNFIMIKRGELR